MTEPLKMLHVAIIITIRTHNNYSRLYCIKEDITQRLNIVNQDRFLKLNGVPKIQFRTNLVFCRLYCTSSRILPARPASISSPCCLTPRILLWKSRGLHSSHICLADPDFTKSTANITLRVVNSCQYPWRIHDPR